MLTESLLKSNKLNSFNEFWKSDDQSNTRAPETRNINCSSSFAVGNGYKSQSKSEQFKDAKR